MTTKPSFCFCVLLLLFCSVHGQLRGPKIIQNNIDETLLSRFYVTNLNSNALDTTDSDSDFGLNEIDIVQKYGYPIEVHQNIATEDGYVLEIHRIPFGKKSGITSDTQRPVLFLMHGLVSSSHDFVVSGENSLTFLAADQGYDVWMGNARGNKYSRKHLQYNPDSDAKFWDFSWHEIGLYDLPASIDYILKTTGQSQLFYLGHSQGATSFFIMSSMRPEFNSKIKLMVAFGPAVFMSHVPCQLCQLLGRNEANKNTALSLLQTFGMRNEMSRNKFPISWLLNQCIQVKSFQQTCLRLMFSLLGEDYDQFNITRLPIFMTSAPTGSSTKQFLHYLQGVPTGKFAMYNYGQEMNKQKYGQSEPPSYELSKVNIPVVLFYSENDHLVGVEDVMELASKLPNVKELYKVPLKKFNHVDYLWAMDAKTLVYDKLFDVLNATKDTTE